MIVYRKPIEFPDQSAIFSEHSEDVACLVSLREAHWRVPLSSKARRVTLSNLVRAYAHRLHHPLSRVATIECGAPLFRDGTTSLEVGAASALRCKILELFNGDSGGNGLAVLLDAAYYAGVKAPKFRHGPSRTNADRRGISIGFLSADNVPARIREISRFYRTSPLPVEVKAIVAQAAILNLHPLNDGNGRLSRVLFNVLFWRDRFRPVLYLPIYELRAHSPYTFEICLRSAELYGDWGPLINFYTRFVLHHKAAVCEQAVCRRRVE